MPVMKHPYRWALLGAVYYGFSHLFIGVLAQVVGYWVQDLVYSPVWTYYLPGFFISAGDGALHISLHNLVWLFIAFEIWNRNLLAFLAAFFVLTFDGIYFSYVDGLTSGIIGYIVLSFLMLNATVKCLKERPPGKLRAVYGFLEPIKTWPSTAITLLIALGCLCHLVSSRNEMSEEKGYFFTCTPWRSSSDRENSSGGGQSMKIAIMQTKSTVFQAPVP